MKFIVVSEARADFITATELADRVLIDEIEWLHQEILDSQRQWIGEDSPGNHLAWTTVAHRARELGIRPKGYFDGQPGLPDAQAARRAILYVRRQFHNADAIVLIRDLDDQDERREGIEQARTVDTSGTKIVIGVAYCERECWVICGFDPTNPEEEQRLGVERQNLGANPCIRSHELTTSKSDIALRSPKRVLKFLTGDSWERQRLCWTVTSLDVLKDRGEDNGLASYLEEIKLHLVPLISGRGGTQ